MTQIAATDLAQYVRDMSTYQKKELKALAGAFIETLVAEEVPLVTLRASQFAEAAKAVQAAGETRLLTDGWQQGHEWSDERVGGEVFVFENEAGDLEVADPDSLVAALAKVGVPQDEIQRACFKVWKVSQVELSLIAKRRPDWREVIEDHRSRRKPGPPHLRAREL